MQSMPNALRLSLHAYLMSSFLPEGGQNSLFGPNVKAGALVQTMNFSLENFWIAFPNNDSLFV